MISRPHELFGLAAALTAVASALAWSVSSGMIGGPKCDDMAGFGPSIEAPSHTRGAVLQFYEPETHRGENVSEEFDTAEPEPSPAPMPVAEIETLYVPKMVLGSNSPDYYCHLGETIFLDLPAASSLRWRHGFPLPTRISSSWHSRVEVECNERGTWYADMHGPHGSTQVTFHVLTDHESEPVPEKDVTFALMYAARCAPGFDADVRVSFLVNRRQRAESVRVDPASAINDEQRACIESSIEHAFRTLPRSEVGQRIVRSKIPRDAL